LYFLKYGGVGRKAQRCRKKPSRKQYC